MQVGGVRGFYCVVDVKDAGGACRESAGEGFFFDGLSLRFDALPPLPLRGQGALM